jgi:hypothetical protein
MQLIGCANLFEIYFQLEELETVACHLAVLFTQTQSLCRVVVSRLRSRVLSPRGKSLLENCRPFFETQFLSGHIATNVSANCVWLILKTNLSQVDESDKEREATLTHRTSQMKYAHLLALV